MRGRLRTGEEGMYSVGSVKRERVESENECQRIRECDEGGNSWAKSGTAVRMRRSGNPKVG